MQVFQAENNLKLQNEEKSFSLFQNCLIYGLVRGHGSCKMISIPTEMWVQICSSFVGNILLKILVKDTQYQIFEGLFFSVNAFQRLQLKIQDTIGNKKALRQARTIQRKYTWSFCDILRLYFD